MSSPFRLGLFLFLFINLMFGMKLRMRQDPINSDTVHGASIDSTLNLDYDTRFQVLDTRTPVQTYTASPSKYAE